MRALFFLLILLSAYYIAAAYRFAPLLALCLSEGAVLILLEVCVWVLRWRIRVSLAERSGEAVRGMERACTVLVRNRSRLPAPRLELRLTSRWLWERRGENLRLDGGAEPGESRMEFRVRAAHCGLLLLRLDRMRVYDYLSLFHASRRVGEELCLTVYPEHIPLRLRLTGSDWDGVSRSTPRPGDESGEVLKIREYQPGDSLRRVHWNQSARTEKLWIKEFPRGADQRVHVLLDAGPWDSPWAADAYWQVLYSLSLGLLDAVAVIRFHWLEADAPRFFDADRGEAVRELFVLLYRSAPPTPVQNTKRRKKRKKTPTKGSQRTTLKHDKKTPKGGTGRTPPSGPPDAPEKWTRLLDQIPAGDRFLRLTGDLRLFAEGVEAVQFTPKGLTDQIRAAALDL